jgi:dihydroorotase
MRQVIEGLITSDGKELTIQLENGIIVGFDNQGDERINLSGCTLVTGLVDMKTNLCDPGYEHKEDLATGLQASMTGGFTTICQVPNVSPVLDSKNALAYVINRSKSELVDVLPIGALTKGLKGEELAEHFDLNDGGAVAFSEGYKSVNHTGVLLKSLEYVQPFDGLVVSNPYDKYLVGGGLVHEGYSSTLMGLKGIPSLAETSAIQRDLDILRYTGGKLHFSGISTKEGVVLLKKAKEEGLNISADVHALNLLFNDSTIEDLDTNLKVFPPLREEQDRLSLINGVKSGVIDVIVSNHQPHEEDVKKLEYDYADFGAGMLEGTVSGLLTFTTLTISEIEKSMCVNPRSILKLNQQKFEIGEVFNATIIDVDEEWIFDQSSIKSKSKNSPFLDKKMKGKVKAVFNKGQYQLIN